MSRIHYRKYRAISMLARELRKNLTPSERVLWEVLRKRNLFGYRFLRQHPVFYRIDKGWVEFFIADFYCSELALIVEVDGLIHKTREEYDKERDAKLSTRGITVLRIKNEELAVINNVIVILQSAIKIREEKLMNDK